MKLSATHPFHHVFEGFLDFTRRTDWLAPLAMRLYFGYFWFETGLAKLVNHAGFAQRFANWHVPFPAFSAALSGATDLLGGALLMIGLGTRLATIPMIVNMVVAIALVAIAPIHSLDDFVELDEALYVLILFWLLWAGPGRASIDALIAKRSGLQ